MSRVMMVGPKDGRECFEGEDEELIDSSDESGSDAEDADADLDHGHGCWQGLIWGPVRRLLLVAYGGSICIVFFIFLLICVGAILALRNLVVSESEAALYTQIRNNSNFVMRESAEVFEARLHAGMQVFGLPAAYAVQQAKGDGFSVMAPSSYLDYNASVLDHPLDYDPRFPCRHSMPAPESQTRGCLNGLKAISSGASSVYMSTAPCSQTAMTGADLAACIARPVVPDTAHVDNFVRQPFRNTMTGGAGGSMTAWMGAWVTLTEETALRQYPGFVGDLRTSGFGGDRQRSYNPTQESYFTDVQTACRTNSGSCRETLAMTNAGQGKHTVSYSAPYLSDFGNGLLVSISVPVHSAKHSQFIGVAGADVRAAGMVDLVGEIKFRQTGRAHMYHQSTKTIISSPQWDPSSGSLMTADQITLPDSSGGTFTPGSCDNRIQATDEIDRDGVFIQKMSVLDGGYCVAALIPATEIVLPIEQQRAQIYSKANQLLLTVVLVLAACLLLLVAPCAAYLAIQLSRPLIVTSKGTSKIVKNIGGDLLDGVDMSAGQVGLGEVAQLRAGFLRMLAALKAKRDKKVLPPENPVVDFNDFPANFPTAQQCPLNGIDLSSEEIEETDSLAQLKDVDIPELTRTNKISFRVGVQLILPFTLALALVITFVTVQFYSSVHHWLGPVKAELIIEELQTLNIRTYEKAQLVSEVFGSYVETLSMVRDYTERLYSGEIAPAGGTNPRPPAFSPTALCSRAGGTACSAGGILERDTVRITSRDVDFSKMVWYAPANGQGAPAPTVQNGLGRARPRAVGATCVGSGVGIAAVGATYESAAGSYLENVARIAYFSSDAPYVYWGFECGQAYLQYPYMDLPSFANSMTCGAGRASNWSPWCRDWYIKAKDAVEPGTTIFNSVGVDSTTLKSFVSLSTAIHDAGNDFIGVAAIDVNLGELERIVRETQLYEEGMAYIFDENGIAVIHPMLDEGMTNVRIDELAGGEDLEFSAGYRENMVANFGRTGVWSYPWFNPSTDEMETWHYSYMRIPGTTYQMVLTIVDRDVEGAARRLEDTLNGMTTTFMVVTLLIFSFSSMLLLYLTFMFQAHFATPIENLAKLITTAEKGGYSQNVNTDGSAWTQELRTLVRNFYKLLIALRFGNAAYHKGDKAKEIQNLLEAREIILSQGGGRGGRGMGVCQANLGNAVRGMCEAAIRDGKDMRHHEIKGLPDAPSDRDYRRTLEEAVANGRGLVNKGKGGVSEDTVGGRLLGLGLAYLMSGFGVQPEIGRALAAFREAREIHQRTGSWQSLARLAYCLATFYAPSPEVAAEGLAAAKAGLDCLQAAGRSGEGLPATDSGAVGQLCFAVFKYTGDQSFLRWALTCVPRMPGAVVKCLADAAMSVAQDPNFDYQLLPYVKNLGKPQPKAMLFCLDASGSMSGMRLQTCKSAIKSILKDNADDADTIGFLAFAHYSKLIFDFTQKQGNYNMMVNKVDALDTFGATAFYDAVLESMEMFKKLPADTPKWLIALTDGADGDSKRDRRSNPYTMATVGVPGSDARQLMSTVPNVNVACITVGELPALSIQVVKAYAQAAIDAGGVGIHVEGSDQASISAAFAEVAAAMGDDSLAESL